jgi:predicted transcriptional regulator
MSSAISVRLDSEALRALAQLEATGLSRSEAVRRAILDSAARLQRRAGLAAEVAALEADEDDRRETLEVAAVMEIMRASG